jgi:hypothetical protein
MIINLGNNRQVGAKPFERIIARRGAEGTERIFSAFSFSLRETPLVPTGISHLNLLNKVSEQDMPVDA